MSNEKECPKDPILEEAQQKTPTVKTKKEIQVALKKGGEPAVREKINKYIESTNDALDQVNTYGQHIATGFAVGNQVLGIYNKMIDDINADAEKCGAAPATETEIEEMTLPSLERVLKEVAWCMGNPFGCDSTMSTWQPKKVCEERQPSNKNCKMDLADALKAITEGDIFAILDVVSETKSVIACTSPYFEKFFNIVPFQFYIAKIISELAGDLLKDVVEGMAPADAEAMWNKVPCGRELVAKTLKEGIDFKFPPIPEIPRIPYIPPIELPGTIDILKNILMDAVCFAVCCALTPLLRVSTLTMINLGNKWVEKANDFEGFVDPHKPNPQNLMPELKKTEITSYIPDHVLVMAQEEGLISSKIEVSLIKAFLKAIHEEESILQRHVIYLLMGDANCQTIGKIREIAMTLGEFAEKITYKDAAETIQTFLWTTSAIAESQILNFFEFLGKNMSVLQAIADSKEDACIPDVCATRDKITVDTFINISKAICAMLNPDIGMPAIDLNAILGPTGASKHVIAGIKTQTDALFTKAKLILYESVGSTGKIFVDDYLTSVRTEYLNKGDGNFNDKYSKIKLFIERTGPSIADGAAVFNVDKKSQTAEGGAIVRTPTGGTNNAETATTVLFQGGLQWTFKDEGQGGAVSAWDSANWKGLEKSGPLANAASIEVSEHKRISDKWKGLPAVGGFNSVVTFWSTGANSWTTFWFKGDVYWRYIHGQGKYAGPFSIKKSLGAGLDNFRKRSLRQKIDAAFVTYTDHLNFQDKDELWVNPDIAGTIHFISGDSVLRYPFVKVISSDLTNEGDKDLVMRLKAPNTETSLARLYYMPFTKDENNPNAYPGKIKNYTLFAGIPKTGHKDNPGMKWENGFDAAFTWKDGITYFFKDRYYFGIDTKKWHFDPGGSHSTSEADLQKLGEKIPLKQRDHGGELKIIRNIRDWGSIFGTKKRDPLRRYSKKSQKKLEEGQESIKFMFEESLKTKDGKPKNLKSDSDENDPSSITIGNFKKLKKDFGIDSQYLYGKYDEETDDHEYGYEAETGEFYGLRVYFEEREEEEVQRRKRESEEEAENKLAKFKEEIKGV